MLGAQALQCIYARNSNFLIQSKSLKCQKQGKSACLCNLKSTKQCLSDQTWSLRQKSLLHSAQFSEIKAQNWLNLQKARTNTRHVQQRTFGKLSISPSSRRFFLSSSSPDSRSSCPRLCGCLTGTRGLLRWLPSCGATSGPQWRLFVRAGMRLRKLQTFGTTWAISRGRRLV